MPVVIPNNESRTFFRLFQLAKLSLIGDLEVRPSDFIFSKIGDSSSLSRIETDAASTTIEAKNGIRHPQDLNASSPPPPRQARMKTNKSRNPIVPVVCSQRGAYPRRPGGACPATYVAAPPYSPPT